MKKILIAMVIGLLLVAALATTALADNGPHGGFTSTTDACAGCHRAHTAQSPVSLLKASDEETLCFSCHDGTGAYTDVVNGLYAQTYDGTNVHNTTYVGSTAGQGDQGAPLFGGGFDYTEARTSWNGKGYYNDSLPRVMSPVTSAHNVGGTSLTVYGAGTYNPTRTVNNGETMTLECTSCHTPHGMGGKDGSGNPVATYRLLRYNPTGSNGYEVTGAIGTTLFKINSTALSAGSMGITVAPVAGANGGVTVNDTTTYTFSWPAGATYAGGQIVGTKSHWYSLNDDSAFDGTVAALTSPHVGQGDILTTPLWQPIMTGLADYAPASRGAAYRRPAITASTGIGSSISCDWNPGTHMPAANPPVNTGNCLGVAANVAPGEVFSNYPQRFGVAYFCATCHDRYLADSNSRQTTNGGASLTGDALFKFQHAAGSMSALSSTGGSTPSVTCVDCHNAHGTSATETTLSASATLAQQPTAINSSALLKLDNREMCARCHFGTIGIQLSMTNP